MRRGRGRSINGVVAMVAGLVVVAALVGPCRAGLQRTCSSDTLAGRPRGICGPHLSNLLKTFCRSGYNKRTGPLSASLLYQLAGSRDTDEMTSSSSSAGSEREVGAGSSLDPASSSSAVFVPRRTALSLLRARRTVYNSGVAFRRGLHCECCIHQCSYHELMEYCREPNSFLLQ